VDSRAEGMGAESMAELTLKSTVESRATGESMVESMVEKQQGTESA